MAVLICIFLIIISDVEQFLVVPVGPLYLFFGEISMSSSHFSIGLFLFLLLSYMSCLYILEIKPLSVASFATIFSYFVGYLFFLFFFMVSFAVQKTVVLIRSHCFIFAIISVALGDLPKKFVQLISDNFCLCSLLGVLWCLLLCLSL